VLETEWRSPGSNMTSVPTTAAVTDSPHVLPLRSRVDVPVVAAVPDGQLPPSSERSLATFSHPRSSAPLTLDMRWAEDEGLVRAILDRVDAALDLAEPFARIREAMGEARKMGVTNRAA